MRINFGQAAWRCREWLRYRIARGRPLQLKSAERGKIGPLRIEGKTNAELGDFRKSLPRASGGHFANRDTEMEVSASLPGPIHSPIRFPSVERGHSLGIVGSNQRPTNCRASGSITHASDS